MWFSTTVFVGDGCTGTLIHPRVVVTADHCGPARTVEFGERFGRGTTRSVRCSSVPGFGTGADVQFCVLDSPVDLPVTPVLYGCEVDQLRVGEQVLIVGFGLPRTQTKHRAASSVGPTRRFVGCRATFRSSVHLRRPHARAIPAGRCFCEWRMARYGSSARCPAALPAFRATATGLTRSSTCTSRGLSSRAELTLRRVTMRTALGTPGPIAVALRRAITPAGGAGVISAPGRPLVRAVKHAVRTERFKCPTRGLRPTR